jgi:hypothetical protein
MKWLTALSVYFGLDRSGLAACRYDKFNYLFTG